MKTGINKPIKIIYFTDPICSTCWVIQPILRKLKIEYGEYVDILYHMGGLLPSWDNYNRGGIKVPSDAAQHWNETSELYNIPIDGDIWIEDPLESSYPPSIAFKAAQLQDNDKAISFLRLIQEMVFIGKKNIAKWNNLEKAALLCNLDTTQLLIDMIGRGQDLFNDDIELSEQLCITTLPKLLFYANDEILCKLQGVLSYEQFEKAILNHLPYISKNEINKDPEWIFSQFSTMTESEFSFLLNISLEEGKSVLGKLAAEDKIKIHKGRNGLLYIANAAVQYHIEEIF
jgi:predicted DsbA family dithiol-disulfide isomerase